jgi:flagellar hook-associated protein 3 FlgL
LLINGQAIFDGVTNPDPSAILALDTDNALVTAINAHSATTGVVASRDSSGKLSLTAVDGRNIRVTTTANGETVTQLNGAAADNVYFGTVQLSADRPFSLQTTPVGVTEPGLDALGLDGGSAVTNEINDVADDGLLTVITIQEQEGNVRYAGDPDHDLAIKVGKNSTLEISKNGKAAVLDTGIFAMLKKMEDSLRGEKYNAATGLNEAANTAATLDSGNTGLEELDKPFTNGIIAFTVTDHAANPPTTRVVDIGVNIATDSLTDIAARINGIPGMTASWVDGHLQLETTDTERYSFSYADTSNFLEMSGITHDSMQVQAINQAVADADTVMENLSTQISDFGARVNRIIVQQQIYSKLELSTTENLSEKEDTDFTKALLELKSKETAYEAALASAAKIMQMSLLDFLN